MHRVPNRDIAAVFPHRCWTKDLFSVKVRPLAFKCCESEKRTRYTFISVWGAQFTWCSIAFVTKRTFIANTNILLLCYYIWVGERNRTNSIPLEGKLELSPNSFFFFPSPRYGFGWLLEKKLMQKSLSVLPKWLVKCFPKVLEGNPDCLTIWTHFF